MPVSKWSLSHRGSPGFLPRAGWRRLCSFWCPQTAGPWAMLPAAGCRGDGHLPPSFSFFLDLESQSIRCLAFTVQGEGGLTRTSDTLNSCQAPERYTHLPRTSVSCSEGMATLLCLFGPANSGFGSRKAPALPRSKDLVPFLQAWVGFLSWNQDCPPDSPWVHFPKVPRCHPERWWDRQFLTPFDISWCVCECLKAHGCTLALQPNNCCFLLSWEESLASHILPSLPDDFSVKENHGVNPSLQIYFEMFGYKKPAVPCRRQVFSLSPMGCCNFHYVETTQTTLQGWECSANRTFKEGQFIDITEVSEVSLPMRSILHGTLKILGLLQFKLFAEWSEEKLNAQNSRRVMWCHGICFSSVSREINLPANTFKHFFVF